MTYHGQRGRRAGLARVRRRRLERQQQRGRPQRQQGPPARGRCDVTSPTTPELVQWANRRDYALSPTAPGQDSGPEVIHFIPRGESPTHEPLVLVAGEVGGTVALYEAFG